MKIQGLVAAPLLGFLFGFGWTHCIGPTLAAVQTLAFQEASAARGALLSTFYSFGLGLPLILFAFLLARATESEKGSMKRIHRFLVEKSQTIAAIGGLFLILIGVAQVSGFWARWVSSLQDLVSNFLSVI